MKLINFQPEHLELFDWRENEYKIYNIDTDFLRCIQSQGEDGTFFTLVHDGRIHVIGGLIRQSAKVAYGVTLFSKWATPGAGRYVTRFFKRLSLSMGLIRVTTRNRAFYDEAGGLVDTMGHNSWCEFMGFKFEGIERRADDEGNDYARYGLVLDGN